MAHRGKARAPFSLFSFQDIITCVSGIIILITLVLALELIQRKQSPPAQQTRKVVSQIRSAIAEAETEIQRLNSSLSAQTDRARELAGLSDAVIKHDLANVQDHIKSLTSEIESLRQQETAAAQDNEKVRAKRFSQKADEKKLADLESVTNDMSKELNDVRQENKAYYNPRTADGKNVWLVQLASEKAIAARAGQETKGVVLSTSSSLFGNSEFEEWLDNLSPAADFIFLLVEPEGADAFGSTQTLIERHGFKIGFDLLGSGQSVVTPAGSAGAE